jgi:hypothetical protein
VFVVDKIKPKVICALKETALLPTRSKKINNKVSEEIFGSKNK